ncbi:MAG: MSHA biogenesis protein MshG, partial [Idiomarina sp.]
MANFRYKARTNQGELTRGVIEASDSRGAADAIMKQGLIPVDISKTRRNASNAARSRNYDDKSGALPSSPWMKKLTAALQPKVSLDELIIFCRQMYSLTNAGIPILRAIEGLSDTTQNRRLKSTLKDVHSQLEKGRNLSSALAQYPAVFPKLIIAIVHVGENTGQLEESFQQLALYLEKEQDTRKRIKSATRYPNFVFIALIIALFVLNIFVIPTFASMFSRFKVELPWATQVLLGMSDFFVQFWPLMLVAMVGAVVGVRFYVATPAGRQLWDGLKLKVPIVGSILERSMLARFARSFSVMLKAGVPLTQALSLVAEAVDNAWMEKRVIDMRRGIEEGDNLSRVARQSGLFTP